MMRERWHAGVNESVWLIIKLFSDLKKTSEYYWKLNDTEESLL